MVASNCPSEDLENPDTGQRKVDGATAHIANFYVGCSRKAQMPCEKRTCPPEIAEVLDLADSTAERASTLGRHCSGESLRSCGHYLKLRALPTIILASTNARWQVCSLCGVALVEPGARPESEPVERRLCPECVRPPLPPEEPPARLSGPNLTRLARPSPELGGAERAALGAVTDPEARARGVGCSPVAARIFGWPSSCLVAI